MTIDTSTTTGGPQKVNGNPMEGEALPKLLTTAPLCGATNRRGLSCRSPAEKGKTRCRFHGARAGAPKGKANGSYKHGGRTIEATALRAEARRLLDALGSEAHV